MRSALQRRGAAERLDDLLTVDARAREVRARVERLRSERSKLSKEIGHARGQGQDTSEAEGRARALGDELSSGDDELRGLEERRDELLTLVPNLAEDGAPDGGEDDAVELRRVGEQPSWDFEPRDHLDLAVGAGVLDMEQAAQVSGARFAYLLGPLVRLQLALVNFTVTLLEVEGFTPVVPPVLVREQAMWGTGFFPTDRHSIYQTTEDGLFLAGTSEVPLAGLHADQILDEEDLPLRYAGLSTCFRREAGAAGRDTRGIFRVHQFDKVEMFAFVAPEDSAQEHLRLLAIEERILATLEIPYRVVDIPAGDLGSSAARKFDIEAWMPGQGEYREVTSCSNCTDYQARRLKARVRHEKRTRPVHTLNGTACAVGRTIVALLENGQQADGTVRLPSALVEFGAPPEIVPK